MNIIFFINVIKQKVFKKFIKVYKHIFYLIITTDYEKYDTYKMKLFNEKIFKKLNFFFKF